MAKAKASAVTDEFKYGVKELADATGLQPASVRVGLRDSDFEKAGSQWGWNNQKEFDKVVAFFKDRSERRPDTSKAETAKPKRGKAPAKSTKTAAKPRRKKAA